jgi:hypothetical protein
VEVELVFNPCRGGEETRFGKGTGEELNSKRQAALADAAGKGYGRKAGKAGRSAEERRAGGSKALRRCGGNYGQQESIKLIQELYEGAAQAGAGTSRLNIVDGAYRLAKLDMLLDARRILVSVLGK